MRDKISVDFVMEQKMCSNCRKSDDKYYELKLQLRFTGFTNPEILIKRKNIMKYRFNFMKNYFDDKLNVYYFASEIQALKSASGEEEVKDNIDLDKEFVRIGKLIYKNRFSKIVEKYNLNVNYLLNLDLEEYLDFYENQNYNNLRIVMLKDRVRHLVDKNFGTLNNTEELDAGFEFYFRNNGDRNKISKLFGREFLVEEKLSKKIVGRDSLATKDIWRYTQLIRIIDCDVADKISIKGEEFFIKALNGTDLVLRKLSNGSKKVVSYKSISHYFALVEKCFNK